MKLSVELSEKHEIAYKFLKDIWFKSELTNKELVEHLIYFKINDMFIEHSWQQVLDQCLANKIITKEEYNQLCQKTN